MGMVLGLTGGIATGKSTVVNIFRAYGFPIVDGDVIAREIVEPKQAGLQAIVSVFGEDILLDNGQLDRKKLGNIIFSDEEKRRQLDALLDPILRQTITQRIRGYREEPLVIADIPLLFEAHYEDEMDQVAVVYVPEAVQLERLMRRDDLTKAQALQRIASQLPIEKKKQQADIVFDNQNSLEETKKNIKSWLKAQKFI
jgi:dephospho-CoA kinase